MNLIIESLKSRHEIIQILKDNTHEDIPILKAVFSENVFNKFFRGEISEDSFKIQRIDILFFITRCNMLNKYFNLLFIHCLVYSSKSEEMYTI